MENIKKAYDIGYRDALTDALDIIEKAFPKKEQRKRSNGDAIRSMKDEQLIPIVMHHVCQKHTTGCPYEHCDDCVRAWLQKEADHD